MATSTRIHELLNTLTDGLAARAGLAGVQVASGWLGDGKHGSEFIAFDGEHRLDGEWAAIGHLSREEKITIEGVVYVRNPGADETVIRTARARAQALFAEIEAYIVENPARGSGVRQTRIRPTGLVQTFDTQGRICVLAFEIEAQARLTAS